jgi:hypothetical protein
MKFADGQFNEEFLTSVGEQAVRLLHGREYDALADKFRYALARGRPTAVAIRQDVAESLRAAGGELRSNATPKTSISWLEPNDTGLLAVIECKLPVDGGTGNVLIELVVTATPESKHVTLEEVSYEPVGGTILRYTRDGKEIRSKPWWRFW